MERLTKTTAGELQIGDRFYKANDKTKTVLELVAMPERRPRHVEYRQTDGKKWPDEMKRDTQVFFLRHTPE